MQTYCRVVRECHEIIERNKTSEVVGRTKRQILSLLKRASESEHASDHELLTKRWKIYRSKNIKAVKNKLRKEPSILFSINQSDSIAMVRLKYQRSTPSHLLDGRVVVEGRVVVDRKTRVYVAFSGVLQ